MNIVDLIKDQISGEVVNRLGSILGADPAAVSKAVSGAIPGLLASLSGLVSSSGGAEKMISTLRSVESRSPGDIIGDLHKGNTAEVEEKGGGLLGSLLGGAALPALIGAIAKFAAMNPGIVKSLLSYLAPLVLSAIAGQFKGRALTPSALAGFFEEQKGAIAEAMPPGLSLAEIPGPRDARAVAPPPASGLPAWLLPLAALALLGLLGWYFLSSRPEPAPEPEVKTADVKPEPSPAVRPVEVPKAEPIPDAGKLAGELTGIFKLATDSLTGVKDAATAEAAVPKLSDLFPKIDQLKPLWDKVPAGARTPLVGGLSDSFDKLKDLIAKVLALPGVAEKLKATTDTLTSKLAAFF